MKKLVFILIFYLCFSNVLTSQVVQEWVARYNGPVNGQDYAYAMAIDSAGNVYVTGQAKFAGDGGDITTIKYNSDGAQLWSASYNGPGNYLDKGNGIVVDKLGNVYVTGKSSLSALKSEYITVKYNSIGIQKWIRFYGQNGNHTDQAHSIALDYLGNVYITGESDGIGSQQDFVTIKYDSSGVLQWMQRYAGPGNSYDIAMVLKLDSMGNVYITGESVGSGSSSDYTTIKYNTNGIQLWVQRYNGPGNSNDKPNDLAVDFSGNAYVTGSSYATTSFESQDYATVKYDSNGVQQWVQRYNGFGNNIDISNAIAVDLSGNVLITGASTGSSGLPDYVTIKYNSNGVQQWEQRYSGPGPQQGTDIAYSIAVDLEGGVYVTGESDDGNSETDYATIKYNSSGVQQWIVMFNAGNGLVGGKYITTNPIGNVYVCGACALPGTSTDYCTIKYSQMVGITAVSNELPDNFFLSQNYPNPFNPQTKIKFDVPKASFTSLIIYDLLGREVTTLVNEVLKPGTYEADWDGSNYSSGVYFYKIITESFVETKKMVLMK